MTGESRASTSILITAGEIADIAGVGPSAVSNWKRRHIDFPAEVEDGLFERDDVVSWLRRTGKTVRLEEESGEKLVWRIADALRAVLRVDELPEVLLQLFVLRAAASSRYQRLKPLASLWDRLGAELRRDLSGIYPAILDSIGSSDPDLARALRLSSWVNRLRSAEWGDLIDIVSQLDPATTDWAKASTALLEGFVGRHGARGGEHSSGSSLVEVMTTVLEPIEGTVYDPACGSGVFLASAWRANPGAVNRLYGQEVNEYSWRLGFLHLLLQGADFELMTGDTLLDDQLWHLRADRIAVEPPLGVHLRFLEQMDDDPRWSWGLPPKSSADLAWAQHVAFHLSDSGVGVVVVSPGVLFGTGHAESAIRMGMLQDDVLDAVVYLPPGMLAATSGPVALLVLQKNRLNQSKNVLFVDARQLGTPERGGLRQFTPADIRELREVFQSWRDGTLQPEAQFTEFASSREIVFNKCVLLPSRYISYAEAASEIDGEPIRTRFERLVGEANERSMALPRLKSPIQRQLPLIEAADDRSGFEDLRLGELLLTQPQSGIRQQDDGSDEAIPYVTTRAVSRGASMLIDVPTDLTYGDVKGRLVQRNDLLLVTRGVERHDSVPCASIKFDSPAAYAESLIRLRVDETRVDPDYLRLYLTSRQGSGALAAASTGSVISNLTRDALDEVQVFMPDLETQRRFVDVMAALETQVAEVGSTLEVLRDLYDTVREGFAAGILAPGAEFDQGAEI